MKIFLKRLPSALKHERPLPLLLAGLCCMLVCAAARANEAQAALSAELLASVAPAVDSVVAPAPATAETEPDQSHAYYGQLTNVSQHHAQFNSPYGAANSLEAKGRTEETTDLTLYAGWRLWHGAELWLNPEIDQGFGLSNTVGMAGFPSGEAYKVGANNPYLRVPRAFVRQTFAIGGAQTKLEAAPNQLGGMAAADNLTLTLGKFSVTDIFDTNRYAHDPRADFLNWSVIDAGAFDYAADAWGFTYGFAAELNLDVWTWRAGVFQLSAVPNSKVVAVDFSQYMAVSELERRYRWRAHDGKLKLLVFVNRASMASYADALQLAAVDGGAPDTALVRRRASHPGIALNLEQELSTDLGLFARASANRGDKEAYEFTEINRSLSGGLALKGNRWGRADDTVGVATAINSLSGAARAYFAAGGIGILIGDGQLRYAPEKIIETYYQARLSPHLTLAANYQHVNNPAYNRDRGPVSIYAIRLHVEL